MNKIRYLHIELSSICNASCPACPRYFNNSSLVKGWINPDYMTLEKFKQWFPGELLKGVEHVNLCGNHGDPATNKYALQIMEYLSEFKFKSLEFHSNGSLKSQDFWFNLSKVFSKHFSEWVLIFSVDGLKDTNHIYRRNTNWDKIVTNMKSAVKGGGKVKWEYLVFKHNEHQLEEAKEIATQIGVDSISFKAPFNVSDGKKLTPIPVIDEKGNLDYYIHASELDKFKPKVDNASDILFEDKTFDVQGYQNYINTKGGYSEPQVTYCKSCEISEGNSKEIDPMCGYENEVYVDTHGNVFPCCFIGVPYWDYSSSMEKNQFHSYAWEQYFELLKGAGEGKLNLNTNTLEDIIQNNILHKIHRDKWNTTVENGKPIICSSICGKFSKLNIEAKELQKEQVPVSKIS